MPRQEGQNSGTAFEHFKRLIAKIYDENLSSERRTVFPCWKWIGHAVNCANFDEACRLAVTRQCDSSQTQKNSKILTSISESIPKFKLKQLLKVLRTEKIKALGPSTKQN